MISTYDKDLWQSITDLRRWVRKKMRCFWDSTWWYGFTIHLLGLKYAHCDDRFNYIITLVIAILNFMFMRPWCYLSKHQSYTMFNNHSYWTFQLSNLFKEKCLGSQKLVGDVSVSHHQSDGMRPDAQAHLLNGMHVDFRSIKMHYDDLEVCSFAQYDILSTEMRTDLSIVESNRDLRSPCNNLSPDPSYIPPWVFLEFDSSLLVANQCQFLHEM